MMPLEFLPERYTVAEPALAEQSPIGLGTLTKEEGKARAEALMGEVRALQALMYGAGTHRVLLVLQGLDASGKDGAVRFVIGQGDPVTATVTSFKMPTPAEQSRDFLWRVHAAIPPRGVLGIFNRSHYEDVVATVVRETITSSLQQQRLRHINAFEELLADDGSIVIKCFFHIDETEQSRRLLEREHELITAWKLAPDDWRDRQLFDRYLAVYSDVMAQTSTPAAPWYVVPANRKWYRNLVVAGLLLQHMEPFRQQWEATLTAIQHTRLQEIARARRSATRRGAQ